MWKGRLLVFSVRQNDAIFALFLRPFFSSFLFVRDAIYANSFTAMRCAGYQGKGKEGIAFIRISQLQEKRHLKVLLL
jgi:hypothetical protein